MAADVEEVGAAPAAPTVPLLYRVIPRSWLISDVAPTYVDGLIERLKAGEAVEIRPGRGTNEVYRLVPNPEGCPNVIAQYKLDPIGSPGVGWSQPCIECEGFPCHSCDSHGDYSALARAIIGAILAGRSVRNLSSNRFISSDGTSNNLRTEVELYGERPEREEARDGRPEESETPRPEDDAPVEQLLPTRYVVGGPTAGAINYIADLAGVRLQLFDGGGMMVKELLFSDAWYALLDPNVPGWR